MDIQGWCVRCKKKQDMKDLVFTETIRGVGMAKGICTVCGCKMCKIGVKNENK